MAGKHVVCFLGSLHLAFVFSRIQFDLLGFFISCALHLGRSTDLDGVFFFFSEGLRSLGRAL